MFAMRSPPGRDCSGYYLQTHPSVCWQTAATAGSTRIAYKHWDGTKMVSAESPAASMKKVNSRSFQ